MKANNTVKDTEKNHLFTNQAKSKQILNDINNANFKEGLNVFTVGNKNGEKKSEPIRVKLTDKNEYEFPNFKTMQKEVIQKIYSKESGELLNLIKKSNQDLRLSKSRLNMEKFNNTQIISKATTISSKKIFFEDKNFNIGFNFL